ncbi:hypothetical protein H0E87_011836 [Populus deltoides]|uniref:Uncharacterized protein n=1 Tax=Populus deltoides TaxID=3696 RepID=A0A8T2YGQ4_POPDE|nr:hypothetical protein H0E87_011836 [Populus deltoides]
MLLQFSPPLLSNAPENLVEQGTAGTLFGDDSNIVLHVDQRDHTSSALFIEEGSSNGPIQFNAGAENSTVPCPIGQNGNHKNNAEAQSSLSN